jgi:hypothetical protein
MHGAKSDVARYVHTTQTTQNKQVLRAVELTLKTNVSHSGERNNNPKSHDGHGADNANKNIY